MSLAAILLSLPPLVNWINGTWWNWLCQEGIKIFAKPPVRGSKSYFAVVTPEMDMTKGEEAGFNIIYKDMISYWSSLSHLIYIQKCRGLKLTPLRYTKYLKFNDHLLNKSFFYTKLLILWVLVINTDMQCVPIFPLSHHPILFSPLNSLFLILLFLTWKKASVAASWHVPRGTFYAETSNVEIFLTCWLLLRPPTTDTWSQMSI